MSGSSQLRPDPFFSSALERPAFQLAVDGELAPELPPSPSFVFAKIPVASTSTLDALLRRGFALVETAVHFEKPIGRSEGGAAARFARPGDETAVRAIARSGFEHSR